MNYIIKDALQLKISVKKNTIMVKPKVRKGRVKIFCAICIPLPWVDDIVFSNVVI